MEAEEEVALERTIEEEYLCVSPSSQQTSKQHQSLKRAQQVEQRRRSKQEMGSEVTTGTAFDDASFF